MKIFLFFIILIFQLTSSCFAGGSSGQSPEGDELMNIAWSEANRLAGSGSPYLEQHSDNPVHWIPWSDAVFEEARRRDLPVLVSLGYSSCHWCHVMAHESFEDEAVAEVMNAAQVNVKVDREQHPGVDAVYMEAAQAMTGSGGWPLNVFVDQQGQPFLAVTYLPPDRWVSLVLEVNRIWKEDRDRINTITENLSAHLIERSFSGSVDTGKWEELFLESSRQTYDIGNPGFAGGNQGNKFPPSQAIDWLQEYGGKEGLNLSSEILTAMMDSGIHDRVAGGFHRYAVEPTWRIPHFEKMAYDNAQLMGLYARASVLTGDEALSEAYMHTAQHAADWFLQEMRVSDPDGVFQGYATATDADDPLGEGSFFAWPPSELRALLGNEDGTWLGKRWNLSGEGELPDPAGESHYEPVSSWIPHPRGESEYPSSYRNPGSEGDRIREEELAVRLYQVRVRRSVPMRDDKILTDQNALILEGFVRLARYGGGEKYLSAAEELSDQLIERFSLTGEKASAEPRVYRSRKLSPYITDYGYLAMALAGSYSLFGKPEYAIAAETVAEEAVERLKTGKGDYFSTPQSDLSLFKRSIEEFDGPSPAGQYALGIAFARLYAITGNEVWKERAVKLVEARGTIAGLAPTAVSSLIRLGSLLKGPYTLVVAGPEDSDETRVMLETVRRLTGPDSMVVAADKALSFSKVSWAELEGRTGLAETQLLLCREGSCLLPAFTENDVIDRLNSIK